MIRTCELDGQPGYQYRPDQGPAGTCHTYPAGDDNARRMAMRAATRDANKAILGAGEQVPPETGTEG